MLWPGPSSGTAKARDKFIPELKSLLGMVKCDLVIEERGPGLVSMVDLLEEALSHFPTDRDFREIVTKIYETAVAYY